MPNLMLRTENTPIDNAWFKKLFKRMAADSSGFRIHCWNDEIPQIAAMLPFGKTDSQSWKNGVIIEGLVSQEFVRALLEQKTERRYNGYNPMTPFFTIELGQTFQSTHYGTEIFIENLCPESLVQLKNLLKEDGPEVQIHVY